MPFLKTDKDLWDKIIRINLYGPLNTHKAVAPLMAERGGNCITVRDTVSIIVALRQEYLSHAALSACSVDDEHDLLDIALSGIGGDVLLP